MADQFIILPDDTANTGKKLDTSQVTVAATTVQRERHVIADNIANTYLLINADGSVLVENWDGTNVIGTAAHPFRIDPTGTTVQPVNGTVTANQGGAPWSENITQAGGVNLSGQVAGSLPVTIVSGAGSGGTAAADEAAFTEGTTNFTPVGGEFKNAGTSLTSGQAGVVRMTNDRNFMVDIEKINGSAVTVATGNVPLVGIEGRAGTSLESTAGVIDINIKNVNNSSEGNANPLFVRVTDGTNNMPTGDASARSIHTTVDNASLTATLVPATSGGTSEFHLVAAASNNATSIKGTAGQFYGISVFNNANYPIYVKIYNKATAPAPATDNALLVRVFGVQAGTQRDFFNDYGIPCSSGVGLAIVKGLSDTDNTSVAASDCVVDVDYK